MYRVLVAAILTGIFCALFALTIDFLTDMLARGQLLLVSFISGFLGSLFARVIIGGRG